MSHDYCHCANEHCPKAPSCFRAYLRREDVRIKRKHPDAVLWCAYSGHAPDENGECDDYVDMKEMGFTDAEVGDTENY